MTTEAREICSKYFDDLQVGETFETYGRTVTEYDVVGFGAITGDTNPQHFDETFGAQGPFGHRVAHGALILSFALGLVPIDPGRLIALRRITDLVFKRPVLIGDSIRVLGEVAGRSPVSDETGLVVLAARVVNQDRTAVARMRLEALWRRSPVPAPETIDARGDEVPSDEGIEAWEELSCPPL